MSSTSEFTIPAIMEESFIKFSTLPALAFAGEPPITYGELKDKIMNLSDILRERKIEFGDRVAVLGDNSPNWVIAYLAVISIGAVAVPILPGFPEADVRHILRNSEAAAVFVTHKLKPRIEGIENSNLHAAFSLEDLSELQMSGIKPKKAGKPDKEKPDKISPEDLAVIIYTSGTTGHSKGVMLTHENIAFDTINALKKFPLSPADRFLSILPLSHTFEATGGLLCPLAAGVSIYYMAGLPTPQKLLNSMMQAKPTGVLTVPLVMDKIYRRKIIPQIQSKKLLWMLYQIPFMRKILNKAAGKKLVQSLGGKLRFFMFGGAALNLDVEIFLRDAGISYSTGYGMTETSPIMTINPFGRVRTGSCGQPIPGIEMKIHDPNPETGIGEIVVKGPIVMQGYYKNPEVTKQTFLEDGWLRTGDLGCFDSEGYLFIKGRSKNVIVGPSGENIYPEIIEQKAMKNPYLQEIVVYQSDARILAKVYLDSDALHKDFGLDSMSEPEAAAKKKEILEMIRREINEELPAFSSINRIIEHPEPFEKTPTNKVKRYLYIENA